MSNDLIKDNKDINTTAIEKDNFLTYNDVDKELETAYFSYAASIISFRVLPDVRDGLKPVHRRVLYSMYINGSRYTDKLKKSANVVGAIMGQFHPHGDSAIYGTMVRMAQTFSSGVPFIIGQGNLGSVDGDSPAAMRYTEVKLSKYGMKFFDDFQKSTAFMIPNYDGTLEEPKFLPARIPNILINGNQGIAVGISTSFPPHNVEEIMNALLHLLRNPDATLDEILNFVKGPDFPTGGLLSKKNFRLIYETGEGNIYLRGKYFFEGNNIVFTEIPYQTEKSKIIQQISEAMNDGRIQGISLVRDESDRSGMRLFVKVKQNAQKEIVVNQLFSYTSLKSTFHVCFYALNEEGKPKLYNLIEILKSFIKFREEVIIRRALKELSDNAKRLHVLVGYAIAWENIDEIVNGIKNANSVLEARNFLMRMPWKYDSAKKYISHELLENYKLSQEQADAILSLKLQSLIKIEISEIQTEMQKRQENIQKTNDILSLKTKRLQIIEEEFIESMTQFKKPRLTEIVENFDQMDEISLIDPEDTLIVLTTDNYIKRINVTNYKTQHRGGRGKSSSSDFVKSSVIANTHDKILLFGDKGIVYMINCYEIPEGDPTSKGRAIVNLVSLEKDEQILDIVPITKTNKSIIFVSKNGNVRRNKMQDFLNLRISGKKYMDNPNLVSILSANDDDYLFIGTTKGMAVCTKVSEFREMQSRASDGVRGCRLKTGDSVISGVIIRKKKILTVSENGFGKISDLENYRKSHRGGTGVINMKCSKKTGNVVGIVDIDDGDDVLALSNNGQTIRFTVDQIKTHGRNTGGVLICKLENDVLKFIQRIT